MGLLGAHPAALVSAMVFSGSILLGATSLRAQSVVGAEPARTEVSALTSPAYQQPPLAPTDASSSRSIGASPWVVVLVQTALAERGCSGVAITGSWDQTTEMAATKLLAVAGDQGAVRPDEGLLHRIRAAPERSCSSTDPRNERAARERAHARDLGTARQDRAGSSVVEREPGGRKKITDNGDRNRQHESRNTTTAGKTGSRVVKSASASTSSKLATAAPRPASQHGVSAGRAPIAFIRPMGVGTF